MSGQNVEVVRRTIEHFRTGSPGFVSGDWEPDADYYPVRKFPEARSRHGAAEIEEFFTGFSESWDAFKFVPLTVLAVGDDRVFMHSRLEGTGRDAGIELEGDIFQCVWLRHGKILRWEDHLTEKGAVKALGLDGETIEAALG